MDRPGDLKRAVHLLVGKENFLKKEFIQKLRRSLFPNPSSDEFNFQEFQAENSFHSAIDFVQTAPFLADKRMAVLWGIDELEKAEEERLFSYADNPASSSVLILVSEESTAKKSALLRELSEKCSVTACHPPFERDIPSWVENRAKQAGVSIERNAVALLTERVGKDIASLNAALESLAVFIHPRKDILSKDVEVMIGRSLQADTFGLVDLIVGKKGVSAIKMVYSLMDEGTRAYEIVPLLASQVEKLSKGLSLLKQGIPMNEIGVVLKVHPFFLEKFIAQVKSTSEERLAIILKRLLECDETIKTSGIGDRLSLEKFVLSVCL